VQGSAVRTKHPLAFYFLLSSVRRDTLAFSRPKQISGQCDVRRHSSCLKTGPDRERRTNRLARAAADYVFSKSSVSAEQLYGFCKLTWITNSYDGDDAAYVHSTKLPALGQVFSRDYEDGDLEDVAADIASIAGNNAIKQLILSDTGFTNFYKAYRNSARLWIDKNLDAVLPLFKAARKLGSDQDGLKLIRKISQLPGIPKANQPQQAMRPEYLLTPIFFSLDPRIRFPLINGNEGVQLLLRRLKVTNAPLEQQYTSMIGLYGKAGIKDAADLDQAGRDLRDFIETGTQKATKKLLEIKKTEGNSLPLKDENDVESLQQARSITNKRTHNRLTNKVRSCLSDYTLLEGSSKAALFDVLVKNYDDAGSDLLIEVKSSSEPPHIRMAIGQLMDYWHYIKGDAKRHVDILLPVVPSKGVRQLLQSLRIGILWFAGDALSTCTDWLKPIASLAVS
jgi:hypothetical protein